jgi:hypothetical protein
MCFVKNNRLFRLITILPSGTDGSNVGLGLIFTRKPCLLVENVMKATSDWSVALLVRFFTFIYSKCYIPVNWMKRSRVSSVGIATAYGVGRPGFDSRQC